MVYCMSYHAGLGARVRRSGPLRRQYQHAAGGGDLAGPHSLRTAAARAIAGAARPHLLAARGTRRCPAGVRMQELHWQVTCLFGTCSCVTGRSWRYCPCSQAISYQLITVAAAKGRSRGWYQLPA